MDEKTVAELLHSGHEEYLSILVKSLDTAARQIERIKAATINAPTKRLGIGISLMLSHDKLYQFIAEVEGALKACPAMELNQAYIAQQLGHDPVAFVRQFHEWREGERNGVITDDEATSMAVRHRLIEPETPDDYFTTWSPGFEPDREYWPGHDIGPDEEADDGQDDGSV